MERKNIIPFINDIINKHFEGESSANVVFLTGEAGIGKTTLLSEFAEQYSKNNPLHIILKTECSTPIAGYDIGAVESLHPWTNIISQVTLDEKKKLSGKKELLTDLSFALIKLVPYVGGTISDTAQALKKHAKAKQESSMQSEFQNQQQIFQQYINLLIKVSNAAPLVIIFDDFHWADNSSTDLLFAACRQLIQNKIFFIIAYRAEDASSSREGRGHPIQTVKNEIERYSLSYEVKVDKLDENDLTGFLKRRYTLYIQETDFENWLLKHSGGNPLFIIHLLNTLEEDGIVDRKSGQVTGNLENVKVPDSVNAVIKERISRLSEEIKELLRYASVEGDKFTSFVLSKITETPQLKLLQKLRLLEEIHKVIFSLGKQLIYAEETTAYEFANSIFAKVLYESLGVEEKELLHRLIYDLLKEERDKAKEKGLNLYEINGRLAIHAEATGDLYFAARLLFDNAEECWKSFSEKETLSLIDKSLGLIEKLISSNTETEKAYILKGHLKILSGDVKRLRTRHEESLEDFQSAIDAFTSAGNDRFLIDALNCKAWTIGVTLHRDEEAVTLCNEALKITRRNNMKFEEAKILNTLGTVYSYAGKNELALNILNKTLDIKKEIGDQYAIATTLTNISTVYQNMKNYYEGIRYNLEALEILKKFDNIHAVFVCLNNLGTLYESSAEFGKSLECSFEALKLAEEIGNPKFLADCYINIGDVYIKQKKHAEAIVYLTKGLEIYTQLNEKSWQKELLEDLLEEYKIIGDEEKSKEISVKLEKLKGHVE
jgi:predicted ATPase